MSKELGNVVDPLDVIKEYSVEVLRFYFLRCFASGQDGNFSEGKAVEDERDLKAQEVKPEEGVMRSNHDKSPLEKGKSSGITFD